MSSHDTSELFSKAVGLEESRPDQAADLYLRLITVEPDHVAAHVNLGTIYYNQSDYKGAERHYRAALALDPSYSLAYFDLGNVLDETGRVQEAIQIYLSAIKHTPGYGDAHYNLALAHEKMRNPSKALKHWQIYVKLDKSSPWSKHALTQIKRIVAASRLKLVRLNDKPKRTKRRAKLEVA